MHDSATCKTDDHGSESTPLLYTVEEAAEQLRVSTRFVYLLIEREQLRSVLIGRTRRIVASDLQEYVNSLIAEETAHRREIAKVGRALAKAS